MITDNPKSILSAALTPLMFALPLGLLALFFTPQKPLADGPVFSPGWRVLAGSRQLSIRGSDSCSRSFSGSDRHDCVDFSRGRSSAVVSFIGPDGRPAVELWTAEHSGGAPVVRDALGALVIDAPAR